MKKIFFLVPAFLGFAFVGSSFAQPPCPPPGFAGVTTWTGPTCTFEPISSTCGVSVCFCSGTNSSGHVVLAITEVIPQDTGCSGIPNDQIIKLGAAALSTDWGVMSDLITTFCTNGLTVVVDEVLFNCWAIFHAPPGVTGYPQGTYFGNCSFGSSYCTKSCRECKDDRTYSITVYPPCTYESHLTGDCANGNAPIESPWVFENCYDIHPCGTAW
jgi:hypothetical protein